jgi:branched-chain amino acid transport system permease protein
MNKYQIPASAALIIIVLASLPLFLAPYPISLAGRILAFALLVVSVDLLTGLTGLPSLGQIAYFGVGAYTAGLVGVHYTDNVFVQLLAGVALAALVALVTGAFVVRTSGIVFLMVTLAVGELTHKLADGLDLVGGTNGLVGIPPVTLLPGGEPLVLAGVTYWWVLAVFLLGFGAAITLSRSPLGRSMRGVREAEPRMASIGQRTYAVKLVAFVLAGSIAGAAGTAWTMQTRFISPGDLAFSVSAIALLSVILGGAGTLWGPVIGATIVILVRDYVSGFVSGHGDLMLGVLFVVAVYALPRGIAGQRFLGAVGRSRTRIVTVPEDRPKVDA